MYGSSRIGQGGVWWWRGVEDRKGGLKGDLFWIFSFFKQIRNRNGGWWGASFSHSLATVNSMSMNSAKTLVTLTSAVDPDPVGLGSSSFWRIRIYFQPNLKAKLNFFPKNFNTVQKILKI